MSLITCLFVIRIASDNKVVHGKLSKYFPGMFSKADRVILTEIRWSEIKKHSVTSRAGGRLGSKPGLNLMFFKRFLGTAHPGSDSAETGSPS